MKKIKEIKNGIFARNKSLLGHAIKLGTNILSNRDNPQKIMENLVGLNPQKLIDELSSYKGTLTKAGQLISQYAEYYLSPSAKEKLKKLYTSTHYLDFDQIKDQLSSSAMVDFNIDPVPLAAASIGQVHQAINKNDQKKYVFKIQYKGIEKAISTDLFFIKLLIKSLNIFPKGIDASDVFLQLQALMEKEMDYLREVKILQQYQSNCTDPFFYIPKVYPQYSNQKTICFEFIDGHPLSELTAQHFEQSQDKLNIIGYKIFELFLNEIYHYGLVQTDAHGGNFYFNKDLTQIYLLDFGACLDFEPQLLKFYQNFLKFSFLQERDLFLKEFKAFIKFTGNEISFNEDLFWDYILLMSSPLRSTDYNWDETKLPDELIKLGVELKKSFVMKAIPAHFIFLDRKLLGIFTLLRSLKCRFNLRDLFLNYVKINS